MSTKIPKISIIVPIYKAENYLHRCVDSILAQTFTDFEVLLIDDGSPDKSGEICDEYAKKDSRVRVIHKENGGVSSARQCGIDNAQGEYTIHADPDDWVEPTMLEELYAKAMEDDADMVICDFYMNTEAGQIYQRQQPSTLYHESVLKDLLHNLHGSCWNKLVRRNCYINYNVSFPLEFSLNEDLYVNMALLRNPLKIAYHPRAFYHYVIAENSNSITSQRYYTDKHYKEDVLKIEKFSVIMQGHQLHKRIVDRMAMSMMYRLFEHHDLSSYEYHIRTRKYFLSIFRDRYYSISTKIKILLSCLGFRKILLQNLVRFIRKK